MKCPTDHSTLQIAERHGIEIDYCPDCRGVWLDRGELEKIIDRAAPPAPAEVSGSRAPDLRRDRDDRYDDDRYDDSRHDARRGRKKRGSFLGEIFDF